MNGLELLKNQHREVEKLFDKYQSTDDIDEKRQFLMGLAQKLLAHMEIEEEIFYPAVYEVDPGEIQRFFDDHHGARSVLQEVLDMFEDSHESLPSKVEELKEKVRSHVTEEEGEVFPKCQERMNGSELNDLGNEMRELYQEIMQKTMEEQSKKPA